MRKLLSAVALAGLAGCATTYQPKGYFGGYDELRIGVDTFLVSFNGNSRTSASRAHDFLLLRCADVALANGATHFRIEELTDETQRRLVETPTQATTTGYVQTYGNTSYANLHTQSSGGIREKVMPGGKAKIRLLKANEEGAMDAALISSQLRQRYGITE